MRIGNEKAPSGKFSQLAVTELPTVSRWFCPNRPYWGWILHTVGTPCLFVNTFRGRTECDVLLPGSAFIATNPESRTDNFLVARQPDAIVAGAEVPW